MRLSRFLFCPALLSAFLWTQPANAYDSSWHKTDFWAGEYPHGFTLKQDVTVKIRKEPLSDAPQDIGCALKKGETYHPWNGDRVKSSKLDFLSFVKKVTYRIKVHAKIDLNDEKKDRDVNIAFKPGDTWTWLTYYGEGLFRMEFAGTVYAADQSLFEVSEDKGDREHEQDEWLKLTCHNATQGWLLLEDVMDKPEFEKPRVTEYGKAADR